MKIKESEFVCPGDVPEEPPIKQENIDETED